MALIVADCDDFQENQSQYQEGNNDELSLFSKCFKLRDQKPISDSQGCPLIDLSLDIEPSLAAHTRDSVDQSRVYTSSKSHEETFRVLESSETQTNNIFIDQLNEQSLNNDSSLHAGFKSSSVNQFTNACQQRRLGTKKPSIQLISRMPVAKFEQSEASFSALCEKEEVVDNLDATYSDLATIKHSSDH